MEISNAHHHQEMGSHPPLEEALKSQQQQEIKKLRPQPEQALKCPRCESNNTKFCYYNNYSLTQPRYFCKGCRRYWTQGGSLRNVPVGGGCRKNKRSSSNSNSNSSSKKYQDQELITSTNSNPLLPNLPLPPLSFDPCSDLTLSFANDTTFLLGNPNPNSNHGGGFLDILRGGFVDPTTPSGFQGLGYGIGGNGSGEVEGGVMNMFPFDHGVQGGGGGEEGSGGGENKVVMGLQWPVGGDVNMGIDSGLRDYYWNGVGSSWHGLINSSLM